jgi:hypothetical protein
VVLAPLVAAGIAAGVLGVLLLGAVVAWIAKAFRRWVAPEPVIGALAIVTLLVRFLLP